MPRSGLCRARPIIAGRARCDKLNSIGTDSDSGGGLSAAKIHCHAAISGNVIVALQDLASGHGDCNRPAVGALPDGEFNLGVADFAGCIV